MFLTPGSLAKRMSVPRDYLEALAMLGWIASPFVVEIDRGHDGDHRRCRRLISEEAIPGIRQTLVQHGLINDG